MGVLDAVFDVFGQVGTWMVETIPTLTSLFWQAGTGSEPGQLTFLGVLALAGLSISVIFLLLGVIQNFLHFRG